MNAPVAYDLSRLLMRSFGPGPNGIDRVDLNLSRHFLGAAGGQNCGLLLNRLRPAVIGGRGAAAVLDIIDTAWKETIERADDRTYQAVRRRLLRAPAQQSQAGDLPARIVAAPASRGTTALRLASLLLPQLAMLRPVPRDSIFIHATHFPIMPLFRWLDRRPDVKPVFFIHDLLPIHCPDFFTAENSDSHRQFLEIFLRYGRAAIVNTDTVKSDVAAFLKMRSGGDKPILAAPMPASSIFARAAPPDAELRARPYFVVCGTIEPRKNHLLLLKLWQDLVRSEGAKAPKLVIIGRRGWNNQAVFDLLDRAPWVASHVVEVAGLSTNAMKHIVANACALLMPSFAEGYGFPVIEALAVGTPVIASDIAVFKAIGGGRLTYCNPGDPAPWLEAVRAHAGSELRHAEAAMTESENRAAWEDYFRNVAMFVSRL
jgi:glycosyltransferase involved in cell wall biosynthesis